MFDQETGEDDLTPLIEFLDFVNNADDATFAAEIADHLDVESFSRYLAVQELVGNFDDISGPGNNSYLRYDAETGTFTVVSWDQNLSFGAMNEMVPGGAGGRVADGAQAPPGGAPGAGGLGQRPSAGELPSAPDGRTAEPPGGMGDLGDLPGGMGGMGGMGGNILEERFRAVPELAALYDEAVADLTAELIDSGVAADVLATWVTVLTEHADDLVDTATIEQDAAAVATYL